MVPTSKSLVAQWCFLKFIVLTFLFYVLATAYGVRTIIVITVQRE